MLFLLSACGPTSQLSTAPGGASATDKGFQAGSEAQVARWEAWGEARAPRAYVNGELWDSENATWDCVEIEHQPAFRRLSVAKARHAAALVDEAAAKGLELDSAEVDAMVEQEFASSRLVDHDDDGYAREQLAVAAAERDEAANEGGAGPADGTKEGGDDARTRIDISGSCADGYVPVVRWEPEQIAELGGLEALLDAERPGGSGIAGHEYGVINDDGTFSGGKGYINVWNPYVEKNSEFSLAQIWATRGSGSDLQTVEAGWQDYYGRTLSHLPRLFVFSTSDNYDTGCYNDNCGDWVQTSSSISLNATWSNFSTTNGSQYSNEYKYWRGSSGNWYFVFDGETVGHYPTDLFDSAGLLDHASRISFGGEIVNNGDPDHTATDMGSGADPSSGWQHAAYIRNIYSRTTSSSYVDFDVDWVGTEPGCYDEDHATGGTWDVYMYFGGEGYDASTCP